MIYFQSILIFGFENHFKEKIWDMHSSGISWIEKFHAIKSRAFMEITIRQEDSSLRWNDDVVSNTLQNQIDEFKSSAGVFRASSIIAPALF